MGDSPGEPEALDYDTMQPWVEHLQAMSHRFRQRPGCMKFSVKSLLTEMKTHFESVPFTGSLLGSNLVVRWKTPALEAIKKHFGIAAFREDKHGLGKCIPGWELLSVSFVC